jgi:hypothetical protein
MKHLSKVKIGKCLKSDRQKGRVCNILHPLKKIQKNGRWPRVMLSCDAVPQICRSGHCRALWDTPYNEIAIVLLAPVATLQPEISPIDQTHRLQFATRNRLRHFACHQSTSDPIELRVRTNEFRMNEYDRGSSEKDVTGRVPEAGRFDGRRYRFD